MDLCNPNEVRQFLTSRGFHFSKSLGQNFLIDSSVPRRIAEMSGVDGSCGVLEIGPGIGALTSELSLRAGRVVAVELDKDLPPMLRELLADRDNVEIISGDILKTDLSELAASRFQGLTPCVCANLPYNITSPVISRLIDSGLFQTMTLMIQREVAQRICATEKKGDYGSFSVYVNYYYDSEILFDVPPECFMPAPKVTSSVIHLRKKAQPPQTLVDEKTFFKVVRGAFALRRKTLVNSLGTAAKGLDKTALTEIITSLGFKETVRGEELSIEDFARLALAMKDNI